MFEKKTSRKTFGEMSDILSQAVLNHGGNSRRIDIAFDVYRDHSILNAERTRRGSGTLLFQNLVPAQPIIQWNQFLSSSQDKKELVKFFVNHWKQKTPFMGNKHLYIGYEDNCICFSPDGTVDIPELASNHEEADTRMLLHMNHNIDQSDIQKKFVFHTPGTDVFVLRLSHLHKIHGDIYIKTEIKDRSRIISLEKIKENIESSLDEFRYTSEEFCEVLVDVHAFTGCDTVSSFAGKGKTKSLKIMKSYQKYFSTFKELGESWNFEKGLL